MPRGSRLFLPVALRWCSHVFPGQSCSQGPVGVYVAVRPTSAEESCPQRGSGFNAAGIRFFSRKGITVSRHQCLLQVKTLFLSDSRIAQAEIRATAVFSIGASLSVLRGVSVPEQAPSSELYNKMPCSTSLLRPSEQAFRGFFLIQNFSPLCKRCAEVLK